MNEPQQQAGSETPIVAKNPILKYFVYGHLPEKLQAISQPFAALAEHMVTTLPAGPETSAGLRKLLEAKDCAVRAAIP